MWEFCEVGARVVLAPCSHRGLILVQRQHSGSRYRQGCLLGAGDESEGLGDDAVVAGTGLVLGVVALLALVVGPAEDHGLEELGAQGGVVDAPPHGGDAYGGLRAVGGGQFGACDADVPHVAE